MRIIQKISIFLVLTVLSVVSVLHVYRNFNFASAISKACEKSPECVAAHQAEEEANAAASAAANTANSYQQAVAYKNYEISQKTAQIAQTKATIAQLISDINAAKNKLSRQQDNLAVLLIDMYFDADTDPVMILAGSSSISELAEREARERTVKDQIEKANEEILILKAELEQKQAEQENNLRAEELAEAELRSAKIELENLVAKYSADADAYESEAAAARERKLAAERKYQEEHPEEFRIGSYYGAANSYEWQADCPQFQDYYITYIDGYPVGGFVCECVGYAGWKAYEQYGVYLSWGNANTWDDYGRLSYVVDNVPSAGSIGQSDGGGYGHVWWIESVNADGSVNITEYNNAWATYLYTGDYHFGDFGARTMSAWEASQFTYIHLDQPL